MNEAMNSYTVKAICPTTGLDEMYTVRDDDSTAFFKKIAALKKWLVSNGYTLTTRRSPTNGSAPQAAANVPICPTHGPMVPSKKHAGFYCPKKDYDGTYCKSKADGTPQPAPQPAPMPQAQAVQHAAQNGTPPAPPLFDDAPPPDFDQYYGSDFN